MNRELVGRMVGRFLGELPVEWEEQEGGRVRAERSAELALACWAVRERAERVT